MAVYDHKTIESKWNEHWFKNNLYKATDFDFRPKKYILAELPYPSGKALHAGHMMRFTTPDIYSRYLRMKGYNVMFPIGWDAFGLPAENYAIKTGTHPAKLIADTVVHYQESIRRMGYGIDWDRVIDTSDPNYYKWTQWIFLKLYKAGLAEYKEMPIWWCEELKTVLSDEEVLTDKNGNKISERGEFPVVKKNIKQWVLKITQYADKLLDGLNDIDFPESVKSAQRNWIGKKVGVNIDYKIKDSAETITCFTTRPDTNFGVTFVVVSPEHKLIKKILSGELAVSAEIQTQVKKYADEAGKKSDLERLSEGKKKTGAFTGLYAINPVTKKEVPVWTSDFVLADFGTGAVNGVPAHDKRDYEFATTFGIDVIKVVESDDEVFEGDGKMINSDFLNGLNSTEAKEKIMDYIEQNGFGKRTTTYSIRDWVFSRQRYWGEPIPVIHKQDGTFEAICDPDDLNEVNKTLPLTLPNLPDYTPTNDGLSPLSKDAEWVATKDKDGNPAKRETNTMPNWAGSCWYYIRYIDPKNDEVFADQKKLDYWLPVDKYFGGSEHTTMHLLYSRFWHQFLHDQKQVPTQEPYAWRINGGLLLGADGKKMSKSIGNVVEPIELVEKYGADSLRLHIPFLGPYEDTFAWNESGIKATSRLLNNVYELKNNLTDEPANQETLKMFHKLVKNVTEMVENLKMNTAISEFMIFTNFAKTQIKLNKDIYKDFVKLISPFAPFMAEEIWNEVNGYTEFKPENSVHKQDWPKFDEELARVIVAQIPVQINGKLRAQVPVDANDTEETMKQKVMQIPNVQIYLQGKPIKKFVYIPGKIVNVVN